MNMPRPWTMVLLSVFVHVLATAASAQIVLSGSVSDGSGGPLLTGTVYHVSGTITVPTGQTLTVQPGTIVKFASSTQCVVNGHLAVVANAGNPAIFTDIRDDSAGGDTNGDGPSTGGPGWWRGVNLVGGTASLTGLEVRYPGQSGFAGLRLDPTPGTTVTDCVFREFTTAGIDYLLVGAATVTGTSFVNGTIPVINCPLQALATFTNNSATGNSSPAAVRLVPGGVSGNFSISAASLLGGAHYLNGSITINAGATVTIGAGVIFKAAGSGVAVNVDGTLICIGTPGNEVVFTSVHDDTRGGDTNMNGGATSPAKGEWRGLAFGPLSDQSQLNHTVLSYTGQSGFAAIELNDADIAMDYCLIDHSLQAGVDLNGGGSLPVIKHSHFDDVLQPIAAASFPALEQFVNNTSANCTAFTAITVSQSSFGGTLAIDPTNLIGGVLGLTSSVNFGVGSDITIDGGVVVKMIPNGGRIVFSGLTHLNGGGGEIVFTTQRDDGYGGDTDANGATPITSGYWRGLNFPASASGSVVDNVRVRLAGQSAFPGVAIAGANMTLTNSTIEDCTNDALSLENTFSTPTVTGCAFDRCGIAVDDLFLDSLVNFSGNTATGNSIRDLIQVDQRVLTTSIALGTTNVINGVIELAGSQTIGAAGSLTLGAGLILKSTLSGSQFVVDGTLICNGTPALPVVFTDLADDGWGGDSNKDGPSSGTPGGWRGLSLRQGSDASILDHVVLRHAGQTGFAGVEVASTSFTMRDSRIEACSAAAVDFNGLAATPSIRDCRFDGNAYAMRGLRWDNLVNVAFNQATGNAVYDSPLVEFTAVAGSAEVSARAMIAGAIVFEVGPALGSGSHLTFGRGLVLKAASTSARITDGSGVIDIEGSGLEPVVFTSVADDDWGGDTNKNGPSAGVPGAWRGIGIFSPSSCVVRHVRIRYSGNSGFEGLFCGSSGASLDGVRAEHCGAGGISISSAGAPLDNLVAHDCAGSGIAMNGPAGIHQPLRFATVTGCGNGISLGTWTAPVLSSISWGNTTNYVNATAANLFQSNGSAVLAGTNGNIDADPLFVDAPNGDLRLQATSPCIDAGDFALGVIVAGDHDEFSRVTDHDLDGTVGADMGAHEFCNWEMSFTGQPRIGSSMTFTLTGMPAFTVISIALLDYEYYYPPYGMVLCGSPLTLVHQDIWYVNYGYPVTIPNDPYAVGYQIGVQMGCAVYGNTLVGNIANLYRGVIGD
ncbi:MAG: hypothetical protein H6807_17600 [Planctomycetes bacterium]|nr:hypothetical protein [Planctomycetota bacterium]